MNDQLQSYTTEEFNSLSRCLKYLISDFFQIKNGKRTLNKYSDNEMVIGIIPSFKNDDVKYTF